MKTLLLASVLGYAGLVGFGAVPCPCAMVSGALCCESSTGGCGSGNCASDAAAPHGVYLEARDATVWGGACHVSSQARTGGAHAVLGWAFEGGAHEGVDLAGVTAVAALEGSTNLQGADVFRAGEAASRRAVLWIDAPTDAAADAARGHLASLGVLGDVAAAHRAEARVILDGDAFTLAVPGVLEVSGQAREDRACCTMPESRWYEPLAPVAGSVVGVPERCRVEGASAGLATWSFEEENSAYVGRFGA